MTPHSTECNAVFTDHVISSEIKGLTGYCFKCIDRPFRLRTDDVYLQFLWACHDHISSDEWQEESVEDEKHEVENTACAPFVTDQGLHNRMRQ